MPSVNTDARRKASAAYHAKRADAGLKKVTLWLSDEARETLDKLKAEHGSKDKAAEAAILALARGVAAKPAKAPVATPTGSFGPVRAKPGARLKKR
jgi:hypothetical protein